MKRIDKITAEVTEQLFKDGTMAFYVDITHEVSKRMAIDFNKWPRTTDVKRSSISEDTFLYKGKPLSIEELFEVFANEEI